MHTIKAVDPNTSDPEDDSPAVGDAPLWTGRLRLPRTNGRGWSVEPFEVDVTAALVVFKDLGRIVAGIPRGDFGTWLNTDAPDPLENGDTVWTRQNGTLTITIGGAVYRLAADAETTLSFHLDRPDHLQSATKQYQEKALASGPFV